MSKKTFKFDPDLWFKNKSLRACSMAARGLWVDIMCICHANGGYLHINSQPVDDNQLARMVGEPVKAIRAGLKELGEAGIFCVDDRGLYSSKMRKEAKGAAAKAPRKAAAPRPQRQPIHPRESEAGTPAGPQAQTTPAAVELKPPSIKPKALPWYKTPAGWARKGNEQGVSIVQGEDLDDFKARVASRIPPGPHLDELSKHHRAEILAKVEQYAAKEGEQPKPR